MKVKSRTSTVIREIRVAIRCIWTMNIYFARFDHDINGNPDTPMDVIIQLSQRDSRTLLMENKENLVIGFIIMKVEKNRKFRLHRFTDEQIVAKSDYIKAKHIFLRTSLPGILEFIKNDN